MKYDEFRFSLANLGLVEVPLPSDEVFDNIFILSNHTNANKQSYQSYKSLGDISLNKAIKVFIRNTLSSHDEETISHIEEQVRSNEIIVDIAKHNLKLDTYICGEIKSDEQYVDIIKALIGALIQTSGSFQHDHIDKFIENMWMSNLREKHTKLREENISQDTVKRDKKSGARSYNKPQRSRPISTSSAQFNRPNQMNWETIKKKFAESNESQRMLFFLLKSLDNEVTLQEFDDLLKSIGTDRLLAICNTSPTGKIKKIPPQIVYNRKINSEKLTCLSKYTGKTLSELLQENNFISAFRKSCKSTITAKKRAEVRSKFADSNAPISRDQRRLLLFLQEPETQLPIQQFEKLLEQINIDRLQTLWGTPFKLTHKAKKLTLSQHVLALHEKIVPEKLASLRTRLGKDSPITSSPRQHSSSSSSSLSMIPEQTEQLVSQASTEFLDDEITQIPQSFSGSQSSSSNASSQQTNFAFSKIQRRFINSTSPIHTDQSRLFQFLTDSEQSLPSEKFNAMLNLVEIKRLDILWNTNCPPDTRGKPLSHPNVRKKFNPEKIVLLEKHFKKNKLIIEKSLKQNSPADISIHTSEQQQSDLLQPQAPLPQKKTKKVTNLTKQQIQSRPVKSKLTCYPLPPPNTSGNSKPAQTFQSFSSSQSSAASALLASQANISFIKLQSTFIDGKASVASDRERLIELLKRSEAALPLDRFNELLDCIGPKRLDVLWHSPLPGGKDRSLSNICKENFNAEKLAEIKQRFKKDLEISLSESSPPDAPFRMFGQQRSGLSQSQQELQPSINEPNSSGVSSYLGNG